MPAPKSPPALPAASPTAPGDVVDAHAHLFTVGLIDEVLSREQTGGMERLRKAFEERRAAGLADDLPDMSPGECAVWYESRLRAAGVSRAVVMSVMPDVQWMRDFISAANGHVVACCNVDPRDPGAPELLEREMAAGFVGVKLLPVNRCYRLSDPECRPFFDRAAALNAPLVIHYGVTIDPTGDLTYADPLDLSPVARDYPDLPFVIAHFGAGWLQQVLQLGYQCKNVYVDTSGTNNWTDYHVPRMTLPEVFERALTALGPGRVIFGTDSGTTSPYREWIKFQQLRVLEELGLSDGDRDLIVRGNAVRVFGLAREGGGDG